MKRAEPDSNRSSNNLPYRNEDGQSARPTGAGYNGGAQGALRGTVPTIKTEPIEMAHARTSAFKPPSMAPAGTYPGVPSPLPHFPSAPSATGPVMFAPLAHGVPQVPPHGMLAQRPSMVPRAIPTPAPNNVMPAGGRDNSTTASVNRNLAPPSAPSGAAASAGAKTGLLADRSLHDSVMRAVKDWRVWRNNCSILSGKEREQYGMAILRHIATMPERERCQRRGMVMDVLRVIGTQAFLVDSPEARLLVGLLASLRLDDLLAEVLEIEAVKKSLLDVTAPEETPLHVAIDSYNSVAARMILSCDDQHGALRMQTAPTGLLPLHWALAKSNDDIVELLLSRAGREQRLFSTERGTALHAAVVFANSVAIVSKLLEDRAVEQVLFQNASKRIPLMVAAALRNIKVVKLLLAVKPALPQQLTLRNSVGETAYDIAKASGDAEIIALFDEAMKELPSSSASSSSTGGSSASAGSSLSSLTAAQQGPGEAPAPMTPYPQTPMAENDEFDLTEYGADLF